MMSDAGQVAELVEFFFALSATAHADVDEAVLIPDRVHACRHVRDSVDRPVGERVRWTLGKSPDEVSHPLNAARCDGDVQPSGCTRREEEIEVAVREIA